MFNACKKSLTNYEWLTHLKNKLKKKCYKTEIVS